MLVCALAPTAIVAMTSSIASIFQKIFIGLTRLVSVRAMAQVSGVQPGLPWRYKTTIAPDRCPRFLVFPENTLCH